MVTAETAYTYTNSKGNRYYLNARPSANGTTPLHFFSKDFRPDTAVESLPEGKEVVEAERTGLPILRKVAA